MLRAALWPALLTIVLFAPCLGGGFCYDDESMLLDNPRIEKATAGSIFATDYWGLDGTRKWYYIHYRPLAMLSLATIYRLFGLSPFAFHGANILLHAIATACFYWLLLGLRQRQSVAMAATLLFAVHPLHVEPVAWMIGLTETQAAAFTLASLACFAWGKRIAAVLLAIPAVFTKEGGMILPALVFALQWWRTPEPAKDKARAATRAMVPYAALAAVYAIVRGILFVSPPPDELRQAIRKGLPDLPAVAAANLKALFIPWPLAIHYELPGRTVILAVLIAVVLFLFALLRFPRLRDDLSLAGVLIFIPLIIPIASSPLRSEWLHVQDRLEYLATAGACFLAAAMLARLPGRGLWLACLLLLPLGALGTYLQIDVWEDAETLWTHTLVVTPTSLRAADMLIYRLYMERRPDEARNVAVAALRYHPDDPYLKECIKALKNGRLAAPPN